MPALTYPIPEIDETITRPLLMQVLAELARTLNFHPDTKVYYNDQGIQMLPREAETTPGANYYLPNLVNGNKLFVELEEIYPEDHILSQSVDTHYNKPLLVDESAPWHVKEIGARVDAKLSLRYRTTDKASANKFRSHVYTRLARGFTHSKIDRAGLSFPISEEVLAILMQVWINRNHLADQLGNGKQEFLAYLHECEKHPFAVETTLAGSHPTLVFRRALGNVVITLETKELDTPQRIEGGAYEVTLNASYYYIKPISYFVQYPIFAYNNTLNLNYFDAEYDRNADSLGDIVPTKHSNVLLSIFDQWENRRRVSIKSEHPIYLPACDDWVVKGKHPKFSVPVIQQLVGVDLNDPTLVMDLKTLEENDGLELNPKLMTYLTKYSDRLLGEYDLPLYFAVYRGDSLLTYKDFYVDDELCLRSVAPLSPTKLYHLNLYLLTNLDLLSDETVEELSSDTFIVDILRFIDEETVETYPPEVLDDGSVVIQDLHQCIEHLPTLPHYPGSHGHIMWTVNAIAVWTHHLR